MLGVTCYKVAHTPPEAASGATKRCAPPLQDVRVCHTLGILASNPGCRHGVNLGNFDPKLIAAVRVRRFDGADTWTHIDE
jgi:hypothetical protein